MNGKRAIKKSERNTTHKLDRLRRRADRRDAARRRLFRQCKGEVA